MFRYCLPFLAMVIGLNGGHVSALDTQPPPPANEAKLSKIGDWFSEQKDKLIPKPPTDPQTDLANQRIEAGKKRLKAAKAKERLEKHKVECQKKTQELTQEYQKAEEDATLYENRLKLQESNVPDALGSNPYPEPSANNANMINPNTNSTTSTDSIDF
ncbi:MAG: hypothetical protein SFT81_03850 [Candidatus Caenarcaniphilales bacterium]|nr:hypothetical protein [Candidatus Caenarcaniphilales bacterium]